MARIAVLLFLVCCAFSESEDAEKSSAPKRIVDIKVDIGDHGVQPVHVDEGEDAAIGAWRFCEGHGVLDPETLVKVAKILLTELNEKADYKMPEDFVLKTVGKYIARFKELVKDGAYDEAGHDIVRAMIRKNVDDHTKSKLRSLLLQAIRDVPKQRKRENKEREEEAKLIARKQAEAEALEEAKKRQAETEEDMKMLIERRIVAEQHDGEVLFKIPLNLKEDGKEREAQLVLNKGQDPHHAAIHFCVRNDLQGSNVGEMVNMIYERMDDKEHNKYEGKNWYDYYDNGHKLMKKADFNKAAIALSEAVLLRKAQPEEEDSDGEILESWVDTVEEEISTCLKNQRQVMNFENFMLKGNWTEALQEIGNIREVANNMELMLLMARAHQKLGMWMKVSRETAVIVQGLASYTQWKRGQPRMIAVQLGSQAALEVGNIDKALKFYKSVLKFDPEQKEVRSQFRGLKKVQTILREVDNHIIQARNHKAVDLLEDTLAKLRGMQIHSLLFRSAILLRLCRAQTGRKLFETAIETCTQALEIRQKPSHGIQSDPASVVEALTTRSEAHTKDNNHDEAIADLRAAAELLSGDSEDIQDKLRRAEHLRNDWKENRNHYLVLQLPANLHELDDHGRKCRYIKRNYMKLAKKWHPDKNRGKKKTAERKMREIAEAKQELFKENHCKGR